MASRMQSLVNYSVSSIILLFLTTVVRCRSEFSAESRNEFVMTEYDITDYEIEFDYDYVTCGSSLKLLNTRHNVRLHSHDVKYGSGSGQQSVTAVEGADDHNSYWMVKPKMGEDCVRGEPIRCYQTVRLLHVNTRRNLHSHHFTSPLSHNLEVSAFGEGGDGDEGDHWAVICNGDFWRRDEKIRLKHVVTDSYLHVTGDSFGRPIYGQREVSGYSTANDWNYWKAAEGIFVKPMENFGPDSITHDEF